VTASSASPRVRPQPRWILPGPPDAAALDGLAGSLRLPEVVCRLLAARGHRDPDAAKEFLRPRLERLHRSDALLGMSDAVERLARAVEHGETILVHGDYDVDGICSTTLITRALRHLGGRVVPFIPRRIEDGYDLGSAGVEAAIREGARVVLTCDCGTSAREPIKRLCEAGIDVIVSDHHLPGGPLPDCLAVLNPRRPGCEYPDKDLAAVGVAFKLALALFERIGANPNFVFHLLDLVALATVADIAPLRGENRVFVRYGLKLLADSPNVGLRALIRASGLEGKPITAGRVGFILAPRLNAVGRVGHAMRGVELLLSESEPEANRIARELEEMNRSRQELDRDTLLQARAKLARIDIDRTFGLVLADDRWHPGVIGIVASRIVEELARPTVLIAVKDGEGKGSGRSISAFDLHAGLGECREHLIRCGGHRAAAGVTIAADRIDAFAARFNDVARERLAVDDLIPELRVDLELPLDEVTDDLEALFRHFEPFGVGNPAPVLVSRGARLVAPPRVLKQEGLKLRLRTASGEIEAIGWGMAHRAPELDTGTAVDIAYRLERDTYLGESRLQLRLADLRH
jgi:single-stranded-DNA-specific exonuclease